MIASLVLATIIPFELLIFSYAFLGPLHYLTEINWLEDKSYFAKTKKWTWFFILLAVLLIIPPTTRELIQLDSFSFLKESSSFMEMTGFISTHYSSVLFIALVTGVTLVYTSKWYYIITSILVACIIGYLLTGVTNYIFIVGVFLPTLIHVYLFTALFMLFGALKSKSKIGVLSFFILILIPIIISFMKFKPGSFEISKYIEAALVASNFGELNRYFLLFFDNLNPNSRFSLVSEIGIKTQIFISFAYIYHYLNWFSKTTVIKWHKSFSKKRVFAIVVTYVLAISLYIYDFKVGFIAMFFLSFLHVLLEFPLNVASIKGIIEELGKRLSGQKG